MHFAFRLSFTNPLELSRKRKRELVDAKDTAISDDDILAFENFEVQLALQLSQSQVCDWKDLLDRSRLKEECCALPEDDIMLKLEYCRIGSRLQAAFKAFCTVSNAFLQAKAKRTHDAVAVIKACQIDTGGR